MTRAGPAWPGLMLMLRLPFLLALMLLLMILMLQLPYLLVLLLLSLLLLPSAFGFTGLGFRPMLLLLLPLLALWVDASLLAAGAAAAGAAAPAVPAPDADPAAPVAPESPRSCVSRIHPRARALQTHSYTGRLLPLTGPRHHAQPTAKPSPPAPRTHVSSRFLSLPITRNPHLYFLPPVPTRPATFLSRAPAKAPNPKQILVLAHPGAAPPPPPATPYPPTTRLRSAAAYWDATMHRCCRRCPPAIAKPIPLTTGGPKTARPY